MSRPNKIKGLHLQTCLSARIGAKGFSGELTNRGEKPPPFITKDNVLKVVERMLAVAGVDVVMARMENGALNEPLLLPPPKDKTAAERMRRYRNKHRNTVTDELPLQLNGHHEELASR